jgi:hypothetical protein
VRAVDAREPAIILHQEFARRRTVLGPAAMLVGVVEAVVAIALLVEDGPVRHVAKQQVDGIVQRLGRHQWVDLDEALGVGVARGIALLDRIAAAERDPGPAVQHASARVEILIDHQHRGTEIAGPDRRRQAGTSGTEHDDVGLVIPLDFGCVLRRVLRRGGPSECGDPCADGRARGEEFASAEAGKFDIVLVFTCSNSFRFTGHGLLPPSVDGPAATLQRTRPSL